MSISTVNSGDKAQRRFTGLYQATANANPAVTGSEQTLFEVTGASGFVTQLLRANASSGVGNVIVRLYLDGIEVYEKTEGGAVVGTDPLLSTGTLRAGGGFLNGLWFGSSCKITMEVAGGHSLTGSFGVTYTVGTVAQ